MNDKLDILEAEAIYIIREIYYYYGDKAVVLYSIGKDSSVLLHLMKKAFFPMKVPFKFLHIDTGWKFKEMINFRDEVFKKEKIDLIVGKNEQAIQKNINPFDHGSAYTDIMKTVPLKKALDDFDFKVAFGGARRDEEKSRAKERIFSVRNENHSWNPKNQRPEIYNNLNYRINENETARVFPLSNWTEIDIWEYIKKEKIEIVPLYFSKKRPYILRNKNIIMVDDDRLKLLEGEIVEFDYIRFRTLGCYPLTGGTFSHASTIDEIIKELKETITFERSTRIIDFQNNTSMEKRKKEGYF